MQSNYTNRQYLDTLAQRVLVFDGAMGTNLARQNLTPAHFGGEKTFGCNDYLVITCPQAVDNVHRAFLEAGVDVIETCTFRSNRITLEEYGLAERVEEINAAAASLARMAANDFSTPVSPRFVAGSIGPTGKLPSMREHESSYISVEELLEVYCQQASALLRGGVDLLLLETFPDLLEIKTAILGVQQACEQTGLRVPLQAQVTLDTHGRMLLGTEISAVLATLEGLPVDVLGLNCSTGPDHMRQPVACLGEHSPCPVSCIPNAGLPLNIDGEAVFPLEPAPFAAALTEFVERYGVSVVGGCCGTTPAHLRALVQSINHRAPKPRSKSFSPSLASSLQAQPLQQEPRPFIIGERLNAQGSRKFKQLLLTGDDDAILHLAQSQVESGAHALDLCVALTEEGGEAERMRHLAKLLTPVISVPLVIDSTEPAVIEAALRVIPGRSLINSTHLESGLDRAKNVFSMAKTYNAAVIALTIDEKGMAKTADRKLEIARRIHELAVGGHGLRPHDLIFDALTFTLATGDPELASSAVETLEGIRIIKDSLPGVLTSLGVSNVSYGLPAPARAAVNSVMLYHAVQAGLDLAIVNPAQLVPYNDLNPKERELAEDLIFNRRRDALAHLIDFYQSVSTAPKTAAAFTAVLPPAERLRRRILHRDRTGLEADIEACLHEFSADTGAGNAAVSVLNQVLLPAMKEVGEQFGRGELILPFVLQSAEVMKHAVSCLEPHFDRSGQDARGTLLLATVNGDIHDIGKNLVKTIVSNNGFNVIDLGKQVPVETIVSRAIELKPDAIGLSALLVSTSQQMPLVVNELQRRGLQIPVLVGGAAINNAFAHRIRTTDSQTLYEAGVFFCRDAFDGLNYMEILSRPDGKKTLREQVKEEACLAENARHLNSLPNRLASSSAGRQNIGLVSAPAWGARVVNDIPLPAVFEVLSKKSLFLLNWGASNLQGAEREALLVEHEKRLEQMERSALADGWIQPRAAYGYWPACAEGDDILVFDPLTLDAARPGILCRFNGYRQPQGKRLCLADYFPAAGSGAYQTLPLQVVTVGIEAGRRFDRLQEQHEYSEAYYVHGLAAQMAEASAEYMYMHILKELRLGREDAKRFSWGYPALPNVDEHRCLFNLLPAQSALGMSLTSAGQLIPEHSTAAMLVLNPDAVYFA